MNVQITYGGQTYVEVEYDLEDTINRLVTVLNGSTGSGILVVTTRRGPVHLLVSRSIPIVIENKAQATRPPGRIL